MSFDDFAVDVDAEDDGQWIEHPSKPGYWVKVRSVQYPEYRRWRDGRIQKARQGALDGSVPMETLDKIQSEGLAKFLLLDWDGFGEAYSEQAAREYLTQRKYRKFRDFVMAASQAVGDREMLDYGDDEGNSKPSSDGKS